MAASIREQLQATLGSAYALERELGGGGMSKVFVAEELKLKRKVVVKVLSPELAQAISVERFEREIQTAAALQQANIVPLLSAGETNGLPFYTMPFVEGESLRARLARGPLSVTEIIGVLRDVSKALAYAHRHGVVHRDIKPDNVLLSEGTAVVTDFGIAKAISAARTDSGHATLTQIGTSIGTPAYMAPEQAAGDPDVDHRADLYSLGAMAYELITGQTMFAGRTPQRMLAAHMSEQPRAVQEFRADIPAPLAELVMSCLEKDPDHRPQGAADLARVLESITSGSGLQAMPSVLLGGAGMFRKALAIYAAAFVVVAIVAKAAIVGIGLPSWVFQGALVVMALGLPVILWTAYVQRVVRRAVTTTPSYTPGGTPSATHGTIATMALKAAPHVSWYRTAKGGMYAFGTFIAVVAAFMTMRALGIGPVGSLLASGELKAADKVLVAEFSVSGGGDSTLGPVVSDAVRAGLVQARTFTLVTPGELAAALRRMQRPVASKVDYALAQQIAEREGIKAILDGSVTTVAGAYIVAVRLVRADSGRELTSQRATAAGADKLIDAADEVARKLLSKAGESLRRVQGAPPLAQVTTSSLEALRKYSEGSRANDREANPLKAVPLLRQAVAIDSNFAEGWRKLAVSMGNAGLGGASRDSAVKKAFALRGRLGDVERRRIEAFYYLSGPGRDRGKGIAAYQALLDEGESTAVLNNLGNEYRNRREFARAESLYRAQLRRTPGARLMIGNLAFALERQGKWAALDSISQATQKMYPDDRDWRWDALDRLWRLGDIDGYARAVDSAGRTRPDPSAPARVLWAKSNLAYFRGQPSQGVALARQAVRADSSVGRRVAPVLDAVRQLNSRAGLDLPSDAEVRALDAALARNPIDRLPLLERPYFNVAMAYARAKRPDRARAILDVYRAETDTGYRRPRAPSEHELLSLIAWSEGRWTEAVAEARAADQLPDGPAHPCTECLPRNLMWMFSEAGMADSAVAAYEEFRRTPYGSRPWKGQDISMPAPLLERMARMFLVKGDTTRAAELYAQFVERWKNADPELQPRVAAAREQLRRMQLDAPGR